MGALAIGGGKIITRDNVPCIGCCDGEPSNDCNVNPVPCAACGSGGNLTFRLTGACVLPASGGPTLDVDLTAMTTITQHTSQQCIWRTPVSGIVVGQIFSANIVLAATFTRQCATCDGVNFFWQWAASWGLNWQNAGAIPAVTAGSRTFAIGSNPECPAPPEYFSVPACPPLTFPCPFGNNAGGFSGLQWCTGGDCTIWPAVAVRRRGIMELLA